MSVQIRSDKVTYNFISEKIMNDVFLDQQVAETFKNCKYYTASTDTRIRITLNVRSLSDKELRMVPALSRGNKQINIKQIS